VIEDPNFDGNERLGYVSWPSFHNFWKKNHRNLVLPKPREDICADCYIAMNKHRFLTGALSSSTSSPSNDDDEDDDDEGDNDEGDDDRSGEIPQHPTATEAIVADEEEEELQKKQEEREDVILKASKHVRHAKLQRDLVNAKVKKAKEDYNNNVPHTERVYTLVADYCQNMGVPYFGGEQAGDVYYFSPLGVYCFGVVDTPINKLHAHVYHEGQMGKGGNQVASLLMKTLKHMELLRENETGNELNIVMDNCGGQNKNRMVLRLALLLVEAGYFKAVNMIFLIVGHTKNCADRLFNALKQLFRKSNVQTMEMLFEVLSQSENVEVLPVVDGDFEEWDEHLNQFYKPFPPGTVKSNHIFTVRCTADGNGKTTMTIIEADGGEALVTDFKKGALTTNERKNLLRTKALKKTDIPGIKPIKEVELGTKWRHFVDEEYKDVLCKEPSPEVLAMVRGKKNEKARE